MDREKERQAIYGYYWDKGGHILSVGFSGFFDYDSRTRRIEGSLNDCWGIASIDGIFIPEERLEFEKNYVIHHDSPGHGSRQSEDIFYKYELANGVWIGLYTIEGFKDGLTYSDESRTQAWIHKLPREEQFSYEPMHRTTRSNLIIRSGYPQNTP